MHKKLVLAALISASLYAEQAQILSDSFIKSGSLLISNGPILMLKPNYYARANSAIYDEANKELILEGDVFINNFNQNSLSKKAVIKLDKSEAKFSEFFISNSFLELWLKAKSSEYKNKKFYVNGSIVSSCATEKPEWQINFSEGEFDNESKDLVLKNMVFRYHNVPLFWLPYFKINTQEARKSGFLTPRLAFKSKEGFYAEMPYFWAINHAQDLELRAQIRSFRGTGLYGRYRLADSPYSNLVLDFGYFKEFGNYASKEQLKYKEHYGIGANYLRTKIFKNNDFDQEGLYLDYLRINDVDFLNLSSFHNKSDDYLITSKLNYFYTNNQDFYSLRAKLYQDTTKDNQSTTIQELPSLQYHRFYDSFGLVDYRFDAQVSNYYRRNQPKLSLAKFDLPLSIKKSFNKGLFNIELKEQARMYLSSKKLDDSLLHYDLESSLGLYTSLFKQYDGFMHSIDAGFLIGYKNAKELPENEFYNSLGYKKGLSLKANIHQKFKFANSALKHRLLIETKKFKPELLESDAVYENKRIKVWNNAKINLATSELERFFLKADYKQDEFSLGAGFYYNKRKDYLDSFKSDIFYERYLQTSLLVNIDQANAFYTKGYYNLNNKRFENFALGFVHKRRCINYTIEYSQKNSSKLTQSGVKSTKDRGIYLRFNLYPIGGVKYNFALGDEGDL